MLSSQSTHQRTAFKMSSSQSSQMTLTMTKVFVSFSFSTDMPQCFVLTKTEYQNAVYDFKMGQKTKRFDFLLGMKFVQDYWSYAKTVEFNNILQEIVCNYNQVVYDIGDYVDKVYILKSGKLSVETYVEISSKNVYPVGHNEWEKREVKKQILYKVRTILPGEIFGHEEFIREDDMYDHSTQRIFKVKSILHSEVIYAKKNDFLHFINKSDAQLLKQQAFTVDKAQIAKRIKDHKVGKRRISEAIMDATKINCTTSYLTATGPLKGGGFTSMIRTSEV